MSDKPQIDPESLLGFQLERDRKKLAENLEFISMVATDLQHRYHNTPGEPEVTMQLSLTLNRINSALAIMAKYT